MKTVIEVLNDQTGDKPVLQLIRQIGEDGKNDPNQLQLYKLILRDLEFIQHHGLQHSFKRYFQTHLEDGVLIRSC